VLLKGDAFDVQLPYREVLCPVSVYGTRRNHVGRLVTDTGEDAYRLFAEETLMADDRAFYLKVRDIVCGALSEMVFRRIVSKMRDAANVPLRLLCKL